MENTDHKNEEDAGGEKLEAKPTLAWWQEWGIIISSLVLFLIAPLCCIILANIHRNRAWAEKVRMIGYVVLIPHLLILAIYLCTLSNVYDLLFILGLILLVLPVIYLILGFIVPSIEIKSAFFKVGAFTLIIYIIAAIIIPQFLNNGGGAWENRCKLTLRALGTAQQTFLDGNPDKSYGTWEELIEAYCIPEGYNRTNMIDNYSIVVFIVHKSTLDENGNSNLDSSFSIVAIPRSQRNRLRTFAIGHDQTPRVWVGKSEDWTTENVSLHNIELWEPLR